MIMLRSSSFLLEALLLFFLLNCIGGFQLKGEWQKVVHNFQGRNNEKKLTENSPNVHKENEVTWTPDPKDLLGLYEEEAPERNTEAYFMTKNNSVVTVQVGSTAALRCQVYDVAEHESVAWIRRRDHLIISVGVAPHAIDDRFQVTYNKKLQDWTLHLHYTQPRDTGIYECQLSTHPPIGVLTQLNVIEAITEISGGTERYIQVGSSVHLVCTIKDFQEPPTYVFWYHEDQMINYDSRRQITVNMKDGKSELKIGEVAKQDSGNYTCVPSNARPSSISLHVITGETPAAMQSASSTELSYQLSLAFVTILIPFLTS